ncbi:MAG: glutamine synthetase family protein [Aggregatilineales bacterium]
MTSPFNVSSDPAAIDRVIRQAQEAVLAYVDLQFTDVIGLVKTVTIPSRQMAAALMQGVWFDGSAIEGFARVAESDMYLRPDPTTFAVIPWEADRRIGRLICNVYTPGGEPFPGDPRAALQRALAQAEALGYRYRLMPELEFYLFRQPLELDMPQANDQAGYFDVSDTDSRAVHRAITDALDSMGIAVDSDHHEVGHGQHELDLTPLDALAMADAVMTARLAVKSIAKAHGLFATFMPKPLAGMAGSGMHIHQQLLDRQTGVNVFGDPNGDHGLSEIGRTFLAGQLFHARGMCALLAPLVNSYKRLVSGLEAPIYVTWAQLNRSALVRVPRARPDQPDSIRLELRAPDPSCNPYLAFAAMLHAGLDGIAQHMELPTPAEEDIHAHNTRRHPPTALPTSLSEAVEALSQSDLMTEAIGLYLLERFIDAKRIEWDEYALHVSRWERERYLRTY